MSEKSGAFKRDTTYLDGRITADGRDGWPVEQYRYRLVVARGCARPRVALAEAVEEFP